MSASPIEENVTPPATPPELTAEERLALIEEKFEFLLRAHQNLFLLVKALGETQRVQLKHRQVPGGLQFYWETNGRIVIP